MYTVIIPVIIFVVVAMCKKIPFIGGKLPIAFLLSGLIALLLGGKYLPVDWLTAWILGLDKISYVLWIVLFGSVFSAVQVKSRAMETVMRVLHALLGKSAQGFVLAALIVMYIGGALMGTVVATAAVVGVLVVPILDEIGLSPDLICALLVAGGSMGAIMPPVSNAIIIATSLLGVPMHLVTPISYVSVGIGLVFVSLIFCKVYIGNKYQITEDMISKEKPLTVIRENWVKLIPLMVLLALVLLSSIPGLNMDLPMLAMQAVRFGGTNLYEVIRGIKVVGALTNNVVQSLLIASVVGYALNFRMFSGINKEVWQTIKSTSNMVVIQLGAALFLGAFTIGGQMAAIAVWVSSIHSVALKIAGGIALMLAGMLLGAQSTSQNLLTPILGPAWEAAGVTPVHAAAASAHLAAAGQGLPPADVNTFSVAGLVGAILRKDVNPMKSMQYTAFYCFYLAAAGFLFLFI